MGSRRYSALERFPFNRGICKRWDPLSSRATTCMYSYTRRPFSKPQVPRKDRLIHILTELSIRERVDSRWSPDFRLDDIELLIKRGLVRRKRITWTTCGRTYLCLTEKGKSQVPVKEVEPTPQPFSRRKEAISEFMSINKRK